MRTIPTPGQLAWQRAGFGMFCHFGINTFHDKEWSDGTLPPSSFDPSSLDARQWVQAALDAGMRYVVLTAKHHDGFCLWQTDTTDYSVRSSPWRDGRGDVVEELAAACEDAGLGFGLYLSPWDRNASCYDDFAAYDDFYARQLTELCTRYGRLFEVWFDGAGSEGHVYDWDRIMSVVEEHQPDAMVFNMGRPTIRWVGNEDGLAVDPCHYVVQSTEGNHGGADQEALSGYLPPECDVPIRGNWFWQSDDVHTLKSLRHLMGIYYRSVGLGAGLLLNVPPDRRGLLDDTDAARLRELGDEVRQRFSAGTPAELDAADGVVRVRFATPTRFDHLVLEEDLSGGQRVDAHEILVDGHVVAAGQTVGVRRFQVLDEVTASEVEIRLRGDQPGLAAVTAHATGHSTIPELEKQVRHVEGKVDRPA
jgi:alpha-L-fucosidase